VDSLAASFEAFNPDSVLLLAGVVVAVSLAAGLFVMWWGGRA
jgi:hypothetical protein